MVSPACRLAGCCARVWSSWWTAPAGTGLRLLYTATGSDNLGSDITGLGCSCWHWLGLLDIALVDAILVSLAVLDWLVGLRLLGWRTLCNSDMESAEAAWCCLRRKEFEQGLLNILRQATYITSLAPSPYTYLATRRHVIQLKPGSNLMIADNLHLNRRLQPLGMCKGPDLTRPHHWRVYKSDWCLFSLQVQVQGLEDSYGSLPPGLCMLYICICWVWKWPSCNGSSATCRVGR